MIIDTPGIKELQLWAESDDLDVVYRDVSELMTQCRLKERESIPFLPEENFIGAVLYDVQQSAGFLPQLLI